MKNSIRWQDGKMVRWLGNLFLSTYLPIYLSTYLYCQQGGKFVFTQLSYTGNWDTRPTAWSRIIEYISMTTSVKTIPERRIVQIADDKLFWSPFLVITADSEFPQFSEYEIKILNRYIQCGGTIFIDETSGRRDSATDRAIRNAIKKITPQNPLEKIPTTDAVYKSFYLLQKGITTRFLEGCKIGERYCIVYSQNDLLGAWERDNLGNYIYPCDEQQRWEAKKLTVNIIIYALSGTYKSDAVHIPFIKSKLK
ncbi:MAG: DUF4159 domain-containing protein [Elusimicrobiota bacterium]